METSQDPGRENEDSAKRHGTSAKVPQGLRGSLGTVCQWPGVRVEEGRAVRGREPLEVSYLPRNGCHLTQEVHWCLSLCFLSTPSWEQHGPGAAHAPRATARGTGLTAKPNILRPGPHMGSVFPSHRPRQSEMMKIRGTWLSFHFLCTAPAPEYCSRWIIAAPVSTHLRSTEMKNEWSLVLCGEQMKQTGPMCLVTKLLRGRTEMNQAVYFSNSCSETLVA